MIEGPMAFSGLGLDLFLGIVGIVNDQHITSSSQLDTRMPLGQRERTVMTLISPMSAPDLREI
jgi:hypothetical protein